MHKLLIYISLILSVSSFSQTKSKEVDSLLEVIKTTNKPTAKAKAHGRLTIINILSDIQFAKKHLDTSFVIYKEINDEKGIASSHLKLALYYRLTGAYEKGLNHIKYSIDYAEKTKDTFNIANSLFQKAVLYSLKSDYNKSLEVFYKILAVYKAMDNQAKVGLTLNSIGITYNDLQMYPEAIEAYKKAVSIHEKLKDSVNLPNAYSNLALAYANQEKFDLALKFYRKARQVDINTNNEWGLGINSENIGVVLNEQKNILML